MLGSQSMDPMKTRSAAAGGAAGLKKNSVSTPVGISEIRLTPNSDRISAASTGDTATMWPAALLTRRSYSYMRRA